MSSVLSLRPAAHIAGAKPCQEHSIWTREFCLAIIGPFIAPSVVAQCGALAMRGFVSLGNTTVVCRLPGDRELTSASSYLKKIQPLEGSARPAGEFAAGG